MTGYLNVFGFHITGFIPLKCQGVIRRTLSQVLNLAEVATNCGRCGGHLSIAKGSKCENIETISMIPLQVREVGCCVLRYQF